MEDDFEPQAEPIQRDATILHRLSDAESQFNLAQLEDDVSRIEIVDGVINKAPRQMKQFRVTDCGLPIIYATEKNLEIDVFIIYTDNWTWAGEIHPFEAIQKYREKSGIHDARVIVMGMQEFRYSIADPTDKGMLDVAGFDSAVPAIVHEFVMGNI